MDPLVLNPFTSDAFSFLSLTDSINKIPFTPGRLGELGLFSESGIPTTGIMVEENNGFLSLINASKRGGPGETRPKNPRTARTLNASHYQIDDTILAEEVQSVREFGMPATPRTVETYLGQRMAQITPNFDATLEFQRVGALSGIILDKNGATVYNLFTEFGVTQATAISFGGLASTVKPRQVSATVVRTIKKLLGGIAMKGVGAMCSDTFWDALITHPDVEKTYLYQEGQRLRDGIAYAQLDFGGVHWENYQGYVPKNDGTSDVTPFIPAGAVLFYPLGVPNFFRTVFAPADYNETVNTIGLPRYAKAIPFDNNKGVRLEMQANPLSYCTRPGALVSGTLA